MQDALLAPVALLGAADEGAAEHVAVEDPLFAELHTDAAVLAPGGIDAYVELRPSASCRRLTFTPLFLRGIRFAGSRHLPPLTGSSSVSIKLPVTMYVSYGICQVFFPG